MNEPQNNRSTPASATPAAGLVPVKAAFPGPLAAAASAAAALFMKALIFSLLTLTTAANAQTAWHHPPSPYRFALTVKQSANTPEAGLLLQLPLSGLADPSGRDVLVYAEDGTQLNTRTLGPAMETTTLVQVKNRTPGTKVFAYFGSGQPAPQDKMSFRQPLICEVRNFSGGDLNSYAQVQGYWNTAKTLGRLHTPNIEMPYNPASTDDQFLVEFTGFLNIETEGDHTFMIVTDDAGYLLIDDQLLISHNGRHGAGESARGEQRATVNLTAGPHKLRMLVAEAGGGQMAVLARYRGGRDKAVLQPDAFLRPGNAQIEAVEARRGPVPPLFTANSTAYIGLNSTIYTLVEFTPLAQKTSPETHWEFGDGGRTTSATAQHVYVGTAPREASANLETVTARRTVHFPEKAPASWGIRNHNHFGRFAKTMLGSGLATIDTPTLLGYRAFFEFKDYNPDLQPICRILLKRTDLEPADRQRTMLQLARVTAAQNPDEAIKLYRGALQLVNGDDMPDWAMEPVELLVFVGDQKTARELTQWISQRFSPPSGTFDYLRPYSALISGDAEAFDEQVYKLVHRRENVEDYRETSVQRNALEQRFYDLINANFISDARNVLQQWEMISPEDHRSGALSVARSNLMLRTGQLEIALQLLDKTVQRDPVIARLPEIDLLRFKLYKRLGNNQKTEQLRQRILQDYPNHPIAKIVEKL